MFSSVLSGIQGDHKVTAEKISQRKGQQVQNGGTDAKLISCF
jgi:hypothetical protein